MSDKVIISDFGRVSRIAINRPEVKNAVDPDTMNLIAEGVKKAGDNGARVVILTGTGGSFCSGADIKAAMSAQLSPDEAITILQESYAPALLAIRNSPCPVIAAIDGMAAGIGLDLALACDLRIGSETAGLGELFIRVGLIPDGGGTWSLQRLIGTARAKEMTFTGEIIEAEKALEWGLLNQVFPSDIFDEKVLEYAQKIAMQSPDALRFGKKAINEAASGTFEEALQREAGYQKEIFRGEWGFEGFKAFLEKRKPGWMS